MNQTLKIILALTFSGAVLAAEKPGKPAPDTAQTFGAIQPAGGDAESVTLAVAPGKGSQFMLGEIGDEVIQRYAERLRKVVPKGWSLQTGQSELKIVRDEPVEWYNPISLPAHRDLAELKAIGFVQQSKYVITLAFAPPVAPAALETMRAENAKTLEVMTTLGKKMEPFWGKGHYVPRNDEERKMVAEYDQLKASLHRMPDLNMADASIFVSDSMGGPIPKFYSDTVAAECKQVRQAVEAIIAERPTALHPRAETLEGLVIEKRANVKSYEAWNSPSDPYYVLDLGDVTENYKSEDKTWQETRKRHVTLRPSQTVSTADLAGLKGKRVVLRGHRTEGEPYKPSDHAEQVPMAPVLKTKPDGTPEIVGWRPANRGTGFVVETIVARDKASPTESQNDAPKGIGDSEASWREAVQAAKTLDELMTTAIKKPMPTPASKFISFEAMKRDGALGDGWKLSAAPQPSADGSTRFVFVAQALVLKMAGSQELVVSLRVCRSAEDARRALSWQVGTSQAPHEYIINRVRKYLLAKDSPGDMCAWPQLFTRGNVVVHYGSTAPDERALKVSEQIDKSLVKGSEVRPETQPDRISWGTPIRGIAARAVPGKRTLKLGEQATVTLELKRVAEDWDARVPMGVSAKNRLVLKSATGGSAIGGQLAEPVPEGSSVGVGDVFARIRVSLEPGRAWLNTDEGALQLSYRIDTDNDGRGVFITSQPFSLRVDTDLAGLDAYVRDLVQRAGPQDRDPLVEVARIPVSEFEDNPERYVNRVTLHAPSPIPDRHDAGYYYGRRVALKQLAAGKLVPYGKADAFGKVPFVLGFLDGYRATLAGARKAQLAEQIDRGEFHLLLQYHAAEKNPILAVQKESYLSLWLLRVDVLPPTAVRPGWNQVMLTKPQARAIAAWLDASGHLGAATESNSGKYQDGLVKGPGYTLAWNHGTSFVFVDLGWSLKTLEQLQSSRKVLEGDAAKAMDQLLKQLNPHPKAWAANTPAASSKAPELRISRPQAITIACQAMGVPEPKEFLNVFPPTKNDSVWRIEYAHPLGPNWYAVVDAEMGAMQEKGRKPSR